MNKRQKSLLRDAMALVATGYPEEKLAQPAKDVIAAYRSRAADMERRYRAGETLQQIGTHYGITRERVRQILARRGVTREEGGQHFKTLQGREQCRQRREARYLAHYGCTYEQFWSVNPRGYSVRDDYYRTPIGAFQNQRRNARERGIAWGFPTFWSWWQVWDKSGHWNERGRGHGYVMARHGDSGPYSPQNVKIVLATENVAEYYDRERAIHGRVRRNSDRKAA